MAGPHRGKMLPTLVGSLSVTSAAALLVGLLVAEIFAGSQRQVVVILLLTTGVAGVVGGFFLAPRLGVLPGRDERAQAPSDRDGVF